VLFDEMFAVSLAAVEVEPKSSSLKYPLFVEEFDQDEEYELSGEMGIERLGSKTWISLSTNVPSVRFTLVARGKGKKQIRWNSRTGSDGFKRIITNKDLTGYLVRMSVDGEVLDEFRVP
jgi:hypothetical protein